MTKQIRDNGLAIFFHLVAVLTIAALSGLLFMGGNAADALSASLDPQLRGHGLVTLLVHLSTSAGIWGVLYLAGRRLFKRSDDSEKRVVKLTRGTVMTETLIILPFLLLLISGLAQFTMLNMAGLLANLAGYNAGRAVWVWDAQGVSDDECERRALDGAAHAVAPSVPDDYVGASGGRNAGRGVIFASAYDTGADIEARQAGKLAFARQSVDIRVIRGARTGAEMTYWFNIVFPWFQYMWGERTTRGARDGFYAPMERSYLLPRQLGG